MKQPKRAGGLCSRACYLGAVGLCTTRSPFHAPFLADLFLLNVLFTHRGPAGNRRRRHSFSTLALTGVPFFSVHLRVLTAVVRCTYYPPSVSFYRPIEPHYHETPETTTESI